jgi:hypothetical protein
MRQSFQTLLVSLCLFALPCLAQSQSRDLAQLPEGADTSIKSIFTKALLTPSDGTHGAKFGASAAINSKGNTIVVGAPAQNKREGEVYVFEQPTTGWASATETAKLTVAGLFEGSEFGYAVAISSDGNTVVASIPFGSSPTIYVFAPTNGSWSNGGTLLAELTTTDVAPILGSSLAISSDGATIVAGGDGVNDSAGAVYVYSKPSSGWTNMTQTAKLTASNAVSNQFLGSAVAISGNTIAAGASESSFGVGPGAVYVFNKPASGWADRTQTAELLASDGQSMDELGTSVAISGNTIVAGAPSHEDTKEYQGALYVFVEPASGWTDAFQTAELTASNAQISGYLGTSVAISGNFIVGGAPCTEIGNNLCQGEVYEYTKPTSGWENGTETYDLIAKPGTQGAELGGASSLPSKDSFVISGAIGFKGIGTVDVFKP